MYDEKEEDRLEHVQITKARGKGAPKKKKTAAGEYTLSLLSWPVEAVMNCMLMLWCCREQEERRKEAVVEGHERRMHGRLTGWSLSMVILAMGLVALGGVLELARYQDQSSAIDEMHRRFSRPQLKNQP